MVNKVHMPRQARKLMHLLPDAIYYLLVSACFGRNQPKDDFYWHQRRLQALTPYLNSKTVKDRVCKEARELVRTSPDDARRFAALALIEAMDSNRMDDAIRIIYHCRHNMRTVARRVISDRYQFIWFRNPKVASTSMLQALRACDPDARVTRNLNLHQFYQRYSWEVQNYFTFGFVRHPVHRIRSCWADKIPDVSNSHQIDEWYVNAHYGLSNGIDFHAFCEWLLSPWGDDVFSEPHWMPQHHMLTKPDGSLVDFVGKYESIEDDWRTVLDFIGLPYIALPQLNVKSTRDNWNHDMLDDEIMHQLEKRYSRDYELGGYPKRAHLDD